MLITRIFETSGKMDISGLWGDILGTSNAPQSASIQNHTSHNIDYDKAGQCRFKSSGRKQ